LTYRDPQYLFGKISTSLTNSSSIKRTKRIFNTSYAQSKWPHLHRVYVISGCIFFWLAVMYLPFSSRVLVASNSCHLSCQAGLESHFWWNFLIFWVTLALFWLFFEFSKSQKGVTIISYTYKNFAFQLQLYSSIAKKRLVCTSEEIQLKVWIYYIKGIKLRKFVQFFMIYKK